MSSNLDNSNISKFALIDLINLAAFLPDDEFIQFIKLLSQLDDSDAKKILDKIEDKLSNTPGVKRIK